MKPGHVIKSQCLMYFNIHNNLQFSISSWKKCWRPASFFFTPLSVLSTGKVQKNHQLQNWTHFCKKLYMWNYTIHVLWSRVSTISFQQHATYSTNLSGCNVQITTQSWSTAKLTSTNIIINQTLTNSIQKIQCPIWSTSGVCAGTTSLSNLHTWSSYECQFQSETLCRWHCFLSYHLNIFPIRDSPERSWQPWTLES